MKLALVASNRTMHAGAMFGVSHRGPAPNFAQWMRRSLPAVSRAALTLVTGVSGSGKSGLLRALAHALGREHRVLMMSPNQAANGLRGSLLDHVPGPMKHAWKMLARAGLADASLLGVSVCHLSEGERFRLLMAQALARGPDVICIDEFCAVLDEPLTRALCLSFSRRPFPTSLVVASSRPHLARWLRPDVVLTCGRATLDISTDTGASLP